MNWIYPWIIIGLVAMIVLMWAKWNPYEEKHIMMLVVVLALGFILGPLLIVWWIGDNIYNRVYWWYTMKKIKNTQFSGHVEAAWPETDIADDMQAIETDESGKWK